MIQQFGTIQFQSVKAIATSLSVSSKHTGCPKKMANRMLLEPGCTLAQAKSPVAGNPCVCKLFFGRLILTLIGIKRSKSHFGNFWPYSTELWLGFFPFVTFILEHPVLCSKDNPSTQLLTYVIFSRLWRWFPKGMSTVWFHHSLILCWSRTSPLILYTKYIIIGKCKTQYNVLEIPFWLF